MQNKENAYSNIFFVYGKFEVSIMFDKLSEIVSDKIELDKLTDWIKYEYSETPDIYIVNTPEELADLQKEKKVRHQPFTAVVPSKPNSKWWADLIGQTDFKVYFLQSTDKAVVLFNTISPLKPLPDAHKIIVDLGKKGLTVSKIAEKLGVPRLRLYRLKETNEQFDSKLELTYKLYELWRGTEQ